MVVCAIVRANASTYYCEPAEESDEPRFKLLNPNEETFAGPVPWIFMWQQVEGLVAVVMASAVSFRTLFVRVKTMKNSQGAARPGGLNNNCRNPFRIFWPGRDQHLQGDKNPIVWPISEAPSIELPKIPSPVFTGIPIFILRNNRTQHDTVSTHGSLDYTSDEAEEDYHTIIKAGKR